MVVVTAAFQMELSWQFDNFLNIIMLRLISLSGPFFSEFLWIVSWKMNPCSRNKLFDKITSRLENTSIFWNDSATFLNNFNTNGSMFFFTRVSFIPKSSCPKTICMVPCFTILCWHTCQMYIFVMDFKLNINYQNSLKYFTMVIASTTHI